MTTKQIANRRAKVLAALKTRNYCGWGGDAEFLTYPWLRFKDWCSGQILEGIGSGEFRSSLHNVLCWAMAWEKYQEYKGQLEVRFGLDKLPNS
jgi:hypothetical protein